MWRRPLLFEICYYYFNFKVSMAITLYIVKCYILFLLLLLEFLSVCITGTLCTVNCLFDLKVSTKVTFTPVHLVLDWPGDITGIHIESNVIESHQRWSTYESTISQLEIFLLYSENSSSDCVSEGSSRKQSISTNVSVCLSCYRGEWQRWECAAKTALA